ncbi:hypothetical protein GCM10010393_46830 [Streptomyces gobitricini]|uniref:Uncharacterized protein n=1 Tax=Streptomyces gobitricini TaxID=68211 RepID=A0ABP6A282_9ACTN
MLDGVGGELRDDQPDRVGRFRVVGEAPFREDVRHVSSGGGYRDGVARQSDGCFLMVCHGDAVPFPPGPDSDTYRMFCEDGLGMRFAPECHLCRPR